jgi:serine/threonine protein kinase
MISTTIGEYRILDRVGAGGMGEVYRAVHPKLGRNVAVKVLSNVSRRDDFGAQFLNEARIQAGLHHPNIATLYDFLECSGQACIVMEYVDGLTLAERISKAGPIPQAEALRIFRDVVAAVRYIHSHGIIHRDIKPHNIKISSAGEVKLLDFGIAKAETTPRFTAAGKVIGTFEYLSPERLRGCAADVRSDIWAQGE